VPAVVATTIALSLALPVPSFAGPTAEQLTRQLKELEQQQAQIKKNVENTKQQVSAVRTDKARAEQDLDSILRQIDETNERLAELNEQVEQVTAELEDNIRQLDEAEERVKSRDNLLKSRLRLMYTSGFVSYLDVLMSATSFTDFLDRLEALKSIVAQDKQILENNIRDRNLIEEKKNEVELQLAQVQQLYDETEAIKQDLLAQEKEKEVRIASLSAKEKELVEITEEEQRKNDEIIRKKAEIQKQLDELNRTSRPAYQGGTLAYPLPKIAPITSGFGSRVDPITKKSGAFHQGLDLGAANGTDILAAEAGVVITAGWLSGYGNTVVIDHGNGLWTLYAHIRNNGIAVKEGQEVKRGQKIAEVGMTGRATGYHLHFEVRLNGKYVDPKPYLNLK
jgi:murein DD-endopeptidase MepM/ murein hydrolase activator NlpD